MLRIGGVLRVASLMVVVSTSGLSFVPTLNMRSKSPKIQGSKESSCVAMSQSPVRRGV